jgi:hypothetical protein
VIIDVEGTETGWTITAVGLASDHPFTARIRRCSFHQGLGAKGRSTYCDGKHDGYVAALVKKLRKSYEPGERLFR